MRLLKFIIAWFRIPRGTYCSGCPYWRPCIAPIKIGDGEIAYCIYLDKTDLDLYEDRKCHEWTEVDSGEKKTGKDLPTSFSSLLWDGCKECGIKE